MAFLYKISIIIVVNNNVNLLLDNLNSLINQSIEFQYLELILIGDADLDWENIDQVSKKFDNIYTYKIKDNLNYKNIALKYATAQYIMFLDLNEVLFYDSCESLYDIINENNCDVVSGNFVHNFDHDFFKNSWEGIPLKNGFIEIKNISENPNILGLPPVLGTKIFNKDFLIENNLKFKNDNSIENLIFITESLLNANKIMYFNKPLLKYESLNEFAEIFNENYSILKIIQDLESFYIELSEFHYSYLILRYTEQIFEYVFSNDFSSKYLYEICFKIHFLVEKYVSNNFEPKKELKLLFKLISMKKYDLSVNLINTITEKFNFDNSIIKSKDILFLFYGCDYDVGGLAKAVFNRANLLSNNGYKIKLINVDPYTENFIGENYNNMSSIELNFRRLGFIGENVEFYNILEYFKEKNTVQNQNNFKPIINLSKNIQINEKYIIQKISEQHDLKIFNYYNLSDFNEDELNIVNMLFKEPTPSVDEMNLNQILHKKIIRTEYYVDNCLFIKNIKDLNGHTQSEYLYSTSGFNFLKIEKKGSNMEYKLYSIDSASEIIFNKYTEFWDYFINEACLNCTEKPFLINDCSGHIPSFNNVSSQIAYKIANIHSNPYLEPTYCYGSPMRIISPLECPNELDALVTLTESQKIDFIKEFNIDNIFAIPNLIELEDISNLDMKELETDTNKISIFARISPEKNIEDLVKAFKLVVEKHPQANLNIYGRVHTVGEKMAYKNLKNLIKDLKIENNIIFKGHVNNVYEEMRTSLVTVLVSHIEGLGMVIIESMANRTPVISYDTKYGPGDIINNAVDGFLVEKYNIDQLANKINYCLDNPEKIISMGFKSQKNIFENFALDKIYNCWINVFKEAYFNSIFNDFYKIHGGNYYLNENIKLNKILHETEISLDNSLENIKVLDNEIAVSKAKCDKQKLLLAEQNDKINSLNIEIGATSAKNDKQKLLLTQQNKDVNIQIDEFEDIISDLNSTNEYYRLKNSFKKRALLFLPYLYIIYKHRNIIENLKFYRKISNNDWFNIGFYLNTNSDLSRKKWCKLLTPEAHYTCHGYDENRLPNPNFKNDLSKKEIIKKLGDNNV